MSVLVILLALAFLMAVAYRGYSVILFAPVAALAAVLLTDASLVPAVYTGVFMEKLVGFVKLYFPVFMLGAIFGKLVELSGFARSIVRAVTRVLGPERAMVAIVLVCALLTYGGVSLFVVAFAVYPFAAELFRAAGIPKRLVPGTIALGAFTFTMDALPGTPQIQNIIPTTFFGTDTWAAPKLGCIGALVVFCAGMAYLDFRRRQAQAAGEGYGEGHTNEPAPPDAEERLPHPLVALIPLVAVGVLNKVFSVAIPRAYGASIDLAGRGFAHAEAIEVSKVAAVWAVEGALVAAILMVTALAYKRVTSGFAQGVNLAIGGAMLACVNTASEYGFGAVVSSLPGFKVVSGALAGAIHDPLLNEAVTTTTLAGITGSASGGMSIALATMAPSYLEQAKALHIPPEVLHRVASMASGGMDTLPHNGAVITLLAVTGLTHRQSYIDIFAMTLIKTAAVFVAILVYETTGLY
ncbi:MAG: transporter [Cyanobacteria bacterium RYN_339]|nr:transporter [Cyanobacteria bacterium RYN_339]